MGRVPVRILPRLLSTPQPVTNTCPFPIALKNALLIVLDSVGIGFAPDAKDFGDEGANTMGHIRETVPEMDLPNLDGAGLAHAEALAAGDPLPDSPTTMSWGCLREVSAGKDTTTGHWEIAGAELKEPFATFEKFPDSLVAEMESLAKVTFIGNYSQSGTVILEELGEEHVKTGQPILYTSADSVIQIAAHEEIIPPERLYEICRACRIIADRERIGRVIARPFEGTAGNFSRTSRRHDFSLQPPPTVLNALQAKGVTTVGVGKISDIFADSGIEISHPTRNNAHGMEVIDTLLSDPPESPTLIFANLVDFDMLYGHRRDPQGYAGSLIEFDQWLGTLLPRIDDNTLVMITADHGNDPTWKGTDHTREMVPLLLKSPSIPGCLGRRESFSDIAATLADWFALKDFDAGGSSVI